MMAFSGFDDPSLGSSLGEAHRCYTRMINFRQGWRGHQEKAGAPTAAGAKYARGT